MADRLRACKNKPRVFVTTDLGNEPDDSESLVRYLLYTNQFRTQGIVPATSTHQRTWTRPDLAEIAIAAYAKVVDKLNVHTHPESRYPDPTKLRSLLKCGPPVYGMHAVETQLADGTKLLIERVDASEEPLWVLCWGGANVIAQALHYVRKERSLQELERFCSKLRLYLISEQDDCGPWIRLNFPRILIICSIHGWYQYKVPTWWAMGCPEAGMEIEMFGKAWVKENIQHGPLGRAYPDPAWQIEGDTPSFLYLIPNGLGSPEHPTWGSWGGRYELVDFSNQLTHYADSVDTVVGRDGKTYQSNYATIWRWGKAFQNDFAARIQWSLHSDFSKVNHHPVVIVNGHTDGSCPLLLDAEAGEKIHLDASATYDPDDDALTYTWFHYPEPTMATGIWYTPVPEISVVNVDPEAPGRRVEIELPPPEVCGIDYKSGKALKRGHEYHFILVVEDSGTPSLTTYKRVVVQTTNSLLRGGREPLPRVAEWENQIKEAALRDE